jgi:hypothetical protein
MALSIQGVEWVDLFWLAPTAPVRGNVATVTNKALTTNVATLTFATHTFLVGQQVRVVGVDAVFDGYQTITAITPTTISYSKTNANVTSTAATGTVSPQSVNIWSDDDQRLVADIDPADWLIPHLDETEVVETSPPWPSTYETEELTHDGLWIQAVGGLPGS